MYRSKYTGLVSRAAAMSCSVPHVVMIIRCGIGKSSVESAAADPANAVATRPQAAAAMPPRSTRPRNLFTMGVLLDSSSEYLKSSGLSPCHATGTGWGSVAGGGDGHGAGTGRCRTIVGHQNHFPRSAAMDGVINERTTRVSNSRPRPIVVPTWPMTVSSLTDIDIMVNAKT